ncbi:heavy metal-associated domain-containing protein [Xanthobacter autotrophicus]|nr:heavy metal-associated domain-containing protein [Xanthobacter autotrophicus]
MTNNETTISETPPRVALRYRIEGMDCSSCALKIEDAVQQLGGAEDIQVNFKMQVLGFRLDEAATPRSTVEEKIRGLGYGVAPLA